MKIVLFWVLILFIDQPYVFTQGSSGSIKALWVVRDILKSKNDIQKMLDDAEKAHITDLFVQVRGRSDAYYKSEWVTRAEGLDGSFDPLEYLITRAQGKFKIHAWVNVVYLWSSEKKPAAQDHLLFRNPEWSAVSKSGMSMIAEGLKKLKEKNKEGFFVTPAHDDFQVYFLKVVSELVSRFRIDGIHLDYIRYAGNEYDYSEAMRSKFILTYHLDPLTADRTELKEKKTWFEKTWADFRRNELNRFVERIGAQIKSIRPDILLSAAVWADVNLAQNEMFQEWTEWLKRDWIDLAVPMNYAADNTLFENRIKEARGLLGDSLFSEKVVMGISMYNQKPAAMNDKVTICKKFQLKGISFFSYESVRADRIYFQKMADASYAR